jgi:hypothetical protein
MCVASAAGSPAVIGFSVNGNSATPACTCKHAHRMNGVHVATFWQCSHEMPGRHSDTPMRLHDGQFVAAHMGLCQRCCGLISRVRSHLAATSVPVCRCLCFCACVSVPA